MNKLAFAALAGLTLSAISGAQTITVTAAFAPNFSSLSPSVNGWAANTTSALMAGVNTFGAAGPTRYDNITGLTFPTNVNMVTEFNSWMGEAPGMFPGEFGTRLHFPVKIVADAEFTLSDVTVSSFSTDPGNAFADSFDLSFATFGMTRRGVFYGGDGVLGGGDDVVYDASNPGTNLTLVNELIYVGYGSALDAYDADPGATNQDKINNQAIPFGAYDFSTTFGVRGTGASATTQVSFTQPVPEPATMAALGLGALALLRRRRASK